MKKVSIIEYIQIIKGNLISFLCIMMTCAIAQAFFIGINWCGLTAEQSVNDTLNRYCLHDLEVICPFGINEENIEKIREIEGVDKAEGSFVSYNIVNCSDRNINMKIIQLPEEIDLPYGIEGVLPESKGEVAVSRQWAEDYEVKIGDMVQLKDKTNLLCSDLYVTALLESPLYCLPELIQSESSPYNGALLQGFMYASEDTFDRSSYTGYPAVLIKSDYLYTYKQSEGGYSEKIQEIKKKVEALCESLAIYPDLINSSVITDSKAMQTANMKGCILTRNENKAQHVLNIFPENVGKLKNDIGFMVLVAGLIICFSAVSRLVKKDRVLIGTQLSFGISEKRIEMTYCGFAVAAAMIGCVLGIIIGRFAVLPSIMFVFKQYWMFEKTVFYSSASDVLLLSLCNIFAIAAAAYVSCKLSMKCKILDLLNDTGKGIKGGRIIEKYSFWKKVSLFNKASVNNIMTDKLRVFSTIVSIALSSALIVNGVGFYYKLSCSINYQFSELQDYNQIVFIDQNDEGAEKSIGKALEDEEIRYTPVYTICAGTRTVNGHENFASILVSDRNFDGMLHLYDPDKKRTDPLNGFLMSSTVDYYNDAPQGETVLITEASGHQVEVAVGGLYKSHLIDQQILCSKEKFKDAFGYEPKVNAFLVDTDNAENLNTRLKNINGFLFVFDYESYQSMFSDAFSSVSLVISSLLLLLSVLIEIFMLSNLFEMNIKEKRREAITLLMNGYEVRDAKKYIFADTKCLLAFGMLIGIPLGNLLTKITIYCSQTANTYFSYDVTPAAFVISIVITSLLTLLTGFEKLRIVDRFPLTGNTAYE